VRARRARLRRGGPLKSPIFARLLARAGEAEERRGGAEHRRRLLAGLEGRVIEVGVGSGVSFPYYPPAVTELIAVEPEPWLRARAQEAAIGAPVPVRVVEGRADRLPAEDASMDAGVVAGVLCSVPDAARALAELRRVIRPGGTLRFYEHVRSRGRRGARAQRLLDRTVWPRLFGGCHTARDTATAIREAGFALESCERFSFRPTLVATPVAPRILGRARRP
jgi:ubiquinone/menaquinone biosynthesis C-methylase UbiE